MIPLPPHRTKGPGILGATPEQLVDLFGTWCEPSSNESDDTTAELARTAVLAPRNASER